ncbi:MAG TPA: NPCBM/NEW2 domain-containing protein [Bacteroidales bacterium]|nr:NPCBM/NEW2 domain-containing protein [Bacteroidales bacterium]
MKKYLLSFLIIALAGCNNWNTDDPLEFRKWAPTPPMGWNSWDCYGPTVVESEVMANADYMSEHLKKYGWKYIVVDIRWYVENDKSGGYNEKDPVFTLDQYGRFTPAVNRFPSAAGGKGFKPLADYIHKKGLKFGVHMMRGVPVIAVKNNTPVLGTDVTAADIYSPDNQCTWLHDMYTVVAGSKGAQEYYNSIFEQYADWGVDFVKVDDISGHPDEIQLVRKAIDNCGRPMVLSISPGGDRPEDAGYLTSNVNMWRTSNDFWDNWSQLKNQFTILNRWTGIAVKGSYPDGDMLPLGKIGLRAERGEPRWSNFTKDEQVTLMTLFAIFRSPLMFGGDLPSNDDFTLSLLTNKAVINVNQNSSGNKQIFNNNGIIAWSADDPKTGDKYIAFFNAMDKVPVVEEKAVWKSRQITSLDSVQSEQAEIDITGAEKLYLVISSDDISGFSTHNGNWIEPTFSGPGKKIKLTGQQWVKASSGRGLPLINHARGDRKLMIDGREYEDGINGNALSVIEYDIPKGITRFSVKAGLQSGPAGDAIRNNNARFMVFTTDPAGEEPPDKAEIGVSFVELGLRGTYEITDLWSGEKLGEFTGEFVHSVNRHGAGLYRISKK